MLYHEEDSASSKMDEAAKWYKKAGDLGHPAAFYNLSTPRQRRLVAIDYLLICARFAQVNFTIAVKEWRRTIRRHTSCSLAQLAAAMSLLSSTSVPSLMQRNTFKKRT